MSVAVESAGEGVADRRPRGPGFAGDRKKARVVAPLPPTEPERLPGPSPSGGGEPASARQGHEERGAGIDVSKERLDIAIRPSGEYLRTGNDERGIDSLVSSLREEDPVLVVLEATGGLEQPAAVALATSGVAVAIVNPR